MINSTHLFSVVVELEEGPGRPQNSLGSECCRTPPSMTGGRGHVTLLFILFVTLASYITSTEPNEKGLFPTREEHKQWCFEMKKKYDIIPGQSFGKLPKMMHDLYLKAHCDQFHCKPHPGRGKFKCEPLSAEGSEVELSTSTH